MSSPADHPRPMMAFAVGAIGRRFTATAGLPEGATADEVLTAFDEATARIRGEIVAHLSRVGLTRRGLRTGRPRP